MNLEYKVNLRSHMTDRTIRIAPLSDQVTKKDVLEVFSTFSISRVHKQPGEAYVEF